MAAKQSFRYEEAKKLVEQFPHTSKTKLGQLLFKKHPLLYSSERDADWTIRMVTNKNKWKGSSGISEKYKTDKWIGSR